MASMTSKMLTKLDDPVVCIAADPTSRRIAAWSSKQQCIVLVHLRRTEWLRDDSTADVISQQLNNHIEDGADIILSAKLYNVRVLMVIDTRFSLKNRSETLIVLDVDLTDSNASRVVYTGDICAAYIPDPVFIDNSHMFVALRNGVLHYSPNTGKTAWIGRVDNEPLDDIYFAPDGLYYQADDRTLHTITYDLQGPAYINSYELNSEFSVTNQEVVTVDSEREADRPPYEQSNLVATCLNQQTGQIAYMMAPDEWPVQAHPLKGSQIPIARVYIGNPIQSVTTMPVTGMLGVNVNSRRVEPEKPTEKPTYWVFRNSMEPVRMFLVPLSPYQYLLGLTGGTLCILNTQTGSQKVVLQMTAEISVLKPAFEPSEFFVGLMNGEIHLVNILAEA